MNHKGLRFNLGWRGSTNNKKMSNYGTRFGLTRLTQLEVNKTSNRIKKHTDDSAVLTALAVEELKI